MSGKGDSGLFSGTSGFPQMPIDFDTVDYMVDERKTKRKLIYEPSPKHDRRGHWDHAAIDPILSREEGERLLNEGYEYEGSIYNMTERGEIVKFRRTTDNTYHAYQASSTDDYDPPVLRWLRDAGKITQTEYKKLLKNVGKRKNRGGRNDR